MDNVPAVSTAQLESTLRNLPEVGTHVQSDDDRDTRETWRFEHAGKPYLLYFYPRAASFVLRLIHGNRALREFQLLQSLQKAQVPVPRPSTALIGFRIDGRLGDALIVESIEPARPLGELLAENVMNGTALPNRHKITLQLIDALHHLGKAGYRHARLRLDAFAVGADGKLHFHDTSHVRRSGLRTRDIMRLAHDARRYITRADVLRIWEALGDAPLPARNTASRPIQRAFDRSVRGNNEHFGAIASGEWSGTFMRRAPDPLRWATMSNVLVQRLDWETAWPALLKQIESDALTILKRDDSGDVLTGQITLVGRQIDVIVKRPRRTRWDQPLLDLLRGSRAARTWVKTWQMLTRDVPCELPILLMERRVFGHAIESIIVFQRVPGQTLATIDLEAMKPASRSALFTRAGHILRRIDDLGGFTHGDAKSTNWIVFQDGPPAALDPSHQCAQRSAHRGPTPILVDLYGIRPYSWSMAGLNRLLRAMKTHPQYTPEDSYHLCKGYAPEAKLARDTKNKCT